MYIKLKKGKQEEIIRGAIKKAGSYRKLSKITKITRSSLYGYIKGRLMPENTFNSLLKFLKKPDLTNFISEKLPENWKQIKGGKNCVASKKEKGTFEKGMVKCQKAQSKKLKEWHRLMKEKDPERYYNLQYSRFKKIAGYKYLTKKGEKVRNKFEKDIADVLYKLNIHYKYEQLVKIRDKYFFPDFLINDNIIIECTAWRGIEKAYKLRDKIKLLKTKYKVFVVIPKNLYSYYEILNNHLILGLDEFVPVAQTFSKNLKKEQ